MRPLFRFWYRSGLLLTPRRRSVYVVHTSWTADLSASDPGGAEGRRQEAKKLRRAAARLAAIIRDETTDDSDCQRFAAHWCGEPSAHAVSLIYFLLSWAQNSDQTVPQKEDYMNRLYV
jgi:hypothetical protein